jgi:hypothetical protein
MIASFSFSWEHVSSVHLDVDMENTDNIDDNAREQQALLMLVWTLLHSSVLASRVFPPSHGGTLTISVVCLGWVFVRRVSVVAGRINAVRQDYHLVSAS